MPFCFSDFVYRCCVCYSLCNYIVNVRMRDNTPRLNKFLQMHHDRSNLIFSLKKLTHIHTSNRTVPALSPKCITRANMLPLIYDIHDIRKIIKVLDKPATYIPHPNNFYSVIWVARWDINEGGCNSRTFTHQYTFAHRYTHPAHPTHSHNPPHFIPSFAEFPNRPKCEPHPSLGATNIPFG